MNNINFTARMDVSGIKYNKARWEKIAKEFEKETETSIPDGEITVKNSTRWDKTTKGLDIKLQSAPNCGTDLDITVYSDDVKELMKLPDSKIIANMKKLFLINKQNNKTIKALDRFCDALDKNTLEENEENLATMAYGSITNATINALSKNKITENWDSEWGFTN